MFGGHFAAALAIKATEPRAPTWGLVIGIGVCDLLFGALVLAGVEHVHPTPGQSPGFSLEFIDWSHSLVMTVVWSVLFALLFVKRGRSVAFWCGASVFSHFVLDFLMHPGDLAVWPTGSPHMGLGLWTRWPIGWWFFELAFIAACSAWYLARARRDERFGGRGLAAVGIVLALHITNSPWLAPTG